MLYYPPLPGNVSESFERKCRHYNLLLPSFKFCRNNDNDRFHKICRSVATTEANDYCNYGDLAN